MTHGELAVILEQHGMRVRPRSSGFQSQCPGHDDRKRKRALSVSLGRDGRQLIWCHHCEGDTFDAVRSALDLPAESFFGWDTYNLERLRCTSPRSSVTLIISARSVLNGKALLKRDVQVDPAQWDLPSRTGPATRKVAADMVLLFALADEAGASGIPLMYGTKWAAERLGLSRTGVAKALRRLVELGLIVRVGGVKARSGRVTRAYRRSAV